MSDFAGGNGTRSFPYLIETAAQLQAMGNSGNLACYFKLIADIDLTGVTLAPIGNTSGTPFTGYFDGCGYAIKNSTKQIFNFLSNAIIINLKITDSTITGDSTVLSGQQISSIMTCCIVSNVTITNCCITDSSITSSASSGSCRIGGFCAYAQSTGNTISNCYVDNVSVTKNSIRMYGGLILSAPTGNFNCGNVSNVYVSNMTCNSFGSTGITTNGSTVFGLVGLRASMGYSNFGYISNSIFIGNNIPSEYEIIGSVWNAGLFITSYNHNGDIFAHVSNCYHASTAIRGTATYPSTGTTTNQYGAPTTAYNTQSFYETTLGWDFTNIWEWDSTTNLPKLRMFSESSIPDVKVKVSDSWKECTVIKAKVSGVWKDVNAVQVRDSTGWKKI